VKVEENKIMAEHVTSVKHYFDSLPQRFQPEASKGVKATIQFELGGDGGGTYHVVIDDGTLAVNEGAAAAPTTTLKMNAPDYVKMVNGELSGTMAFMRGMLKVTGNVMMAQKIQTILPPNKLARSHRSPR
jgi:putative sterol carrier protein